MKIAPRKTAQTKDLVRSLGEEYPLAQYETSIMTSNFVKICALLNLVSAISCQNHLTQQDWDLASTINFKELVQRLTKTLQK